jgi:hypothetical protein
LCHGKRYRVNTEDAPWQPTLDGGIVIINGNTFQANYEGGDGTI